jgi:hypothetical protein
LIHAALVGAAALCMGVAAGLLRDRFGVTTPAE